MKTRRPVELHLMAGQVPLAILAGFPKPSVRCKRVSCAPSGVCYLWAEGERNCLSVFSCSRDARKDLKTRGETIQLQIRPAGPTLFERLRSRLPV